VRELVKAGALIVAEIERIQRAGAEAPAQPQHKYESSHRRAIRRKPQTTNKMSSKKKTPAKKKAPPVAAATACSPSPEEAAFLKRINAAKPGTYIKVRLWTDECKSSMETGAKSITAAMKIIRGFSEFHANWSLEFISEANASREESLADTNQPKAK